MSVSALTDSKVVSPEKKKVKITASGNQDYVLEERQAVVRLFFENREILLNRLKGNVTNASKREKLDEIAQEVTALGHNKRNAESIKHCHKNMKSKWESYKIEISHPRTGGGPAPKYLDYFEFFEYYYPNAAKITGVDGGGEIGDGGEATVNVSDPYELEDGPIDANGTSAVFMINSVHGNLPKMEPHRISSVKLACANVFSQKPVKSEQKPRSESVGRRPQSRSSSTPTSARKSISFLSGSRDKTGNAVVTEKNEMALEVLKLEKVRVMKLVENADLENRLLVMRLSNEERRAGVEALKFKFLERNYALKTNEGQSEIYADEYGDQYRVMSNMKL